MWCHSDFTSLQPIPVRSILILTAHLNFYILHSSSSSSSSSSGGGGGGSSRGDSSISSS
jgi:uncharacterized membrane protein